MQPRGIARSTPSTACLPPNRFSSPVAVRALSWCTCAQGPEQGLASRAGPVQGVCMSIDIRSATHDDLPALLDLIHSAYRGERARGGWTHEADLLDGQRTDNEALREVIDDPGQRILLAEVDG